MSNELCLISPGDSFNWPLFLITATSFSDNSFIIAIFGNDEVCYFLNFSEVRECTSRLVRPIFVKRSTAMGVKLETRF